MGCRSVVFTKTHVIQSGFELMYLRMILLPLSPWCWDYRYVLPGLCRPGALNQGFMHDREALQLSLIPGPAGDFRLTPHASSIVRAFCCWPGRLCQGDRAAWVVLPLVAGNPRFWGG